MSASYLLQCSTMNVALSVLKYQIRNKCVAGKQPDVTNERSVKLGTKSNAQFFCVVQTLYILTLKQ